MAKQTGLLLIKLLAIVLIIIIAIIAGALPAKWKKFRDNPKLISYANSFAAGLFFGVGLFHILPEAIYEYGQYIGEYGPSGAQDPSKTFPVIFFISTCSYVFILFLDKVAFRDEAHDHDHDHSGELASPPDMSLNQRETAEPNFQGMEIEVESETTSLMKTQHSLDLKLGDRKLSDVSSESHMSGKYASMVLLVALSLHAIFEGIAVGLEKTVGSAIKLTIAILIHKWAEGLALGARLVRARVEMSNIHRAILSFSIATPVGIVIGYLLSATPLIWSAIFKAMSGGTFIYLSATEIVVEEFASLKDRYKKFGFYLVGSITVGIVMYFG